MHHRFARALAALSAVVLAASPFPGSAADTITLNVRDASLTDVLLLIARQGHFNLVPDQALSTGQSVTRISALSLTGVTPRVALTAIEQAYGLKEIADNGYIRIVPATSSELLNASGETIRVDIPTGNAQAFVQGLQQALPGVVVIAPQGARAVVLSGPPDQVARGRALLNAAVGIDPSSAPIASAPTMIGISHSTPSDLLKQLQGSGYADPPMTVVADDAHNRLIAKGPDAGIKRLADAVALLDTPVPLVTFDVQVLDVQPNADSSNVGIQWGGTQNNTGSSTPTINIGSTLTAFANRYIPIAAQLNALITNGTATALARPSVVVANGKTGKVLVGEQYPIAITNGSLVGGSNVQFIPIGVQLEIAPVIGANGTITVKLKTTYSDLLGKDPVSSYPIVGDRTVDSELTVKDGEPIVIAGLYQNLTSETISKVPLLGNIPVLGEIFKNRQRSHQRDEIVFALYPHIGANPAAPEVSDASH